MKNLAYYRQKYLFGMVYVVVAVLFTAFFPLYCCRISEKIRSSLPLVTVTIESNGKIVTCGGFVAGGAVFSVAHVFQYVDKNECAYEHRNGYTYYHTINVSVRRNGRTYTLSEAYADEENDLCLIPLFPSTEKISFRDNPSFLTSYYLCENETENWRKTDLLYLTETRSAVRLCLKGKVEKGSSGYPVVDYSGDVTGIICSVDSDKNVTYATGGKALSFLYAAYKRDVKTNICTYE